MLNQKNYLPGNILFGVAALLVGVWFSFYNNFFNWDLTAYAAVVLGYDGSTGSDLHQHVYGTLQQQLPADAMQVLIHEAPYREQCFQDPVFFEQQLSFYRVKPLFTGFVWIFYKMGFSIWTALRIPGVLGFVLLAWVLLQWLNTWIKPGWSHLVAALLLSGYAVQLARLVTPDALSNGLVLLLLFVLFYQPQRRLLAWAILVLLALCRIDNLVLALPLAVFHFYGKFNSADRSAFLKMLGAAVVILLLAMAIPFFFGNKANWFFDYSFTQSGFEYVKQMARSVRQFSGTAFPVLVPLVLVALPVKESKWKSILLIILFAILSRWVLFPAFQERFFVAYELGLAVFLVSQLVQWKHGGSHEKPRLAKASDFE